MRKLYIVGLIATAALIIGLAWAEQMTFSTYYPAPAGVYNQMVTRCLGVGDQDGGGSIDYSDAPDPNDDDQVNELWVAGNVGIGTTEPGSKLHVKDSSAPKLILGSSGSFDLGNTIGEIRFSHYNTTQDRFSAGIRAIGTGGSGLYDVTSLAFYTTLNDGVSYFKERMRIDQNGNVGIGTAGPRALLDLGGGNTQPLPTNTKLWIRGAGSGANPAVIQSRISLGVDNNLDYGAFIGAVNIDGSGSGMALALGDRGAGSDHVAMYLRNRNVGIGTASPQTAPSPANNATSGNLEVNDVYLSSTGQWVSGGGFSPASYTGQESITFPNGLIMKQGYVAQGGYTTPVSFVVSFSGIKSVSITGKRAQGVAMRATVSTPTTSGFTIYDPDQQVDGYHWQAWGY